jgi:hypothetical protein
VRAGRIRCDVSLSFPSHSPPTDLCPVRTSGWTALLPLSIAWSVQYTLQRIFTKRASAYFAAHIDQMMSRTKRPLYPEMSIYFFHGLVAPITSSAVATLLVYPLTTLCLRATFSHVGLVSVRVWCASM